ncbi:MAG: amidohydrolase [Ignavibacteriaceae bacterium]
MSFNFIKGEVISPQELRHILHQNPELSFHEFETTNLLRKSIEELKDSSKLKIHSPYRTGLLVEYRVNNSGYILFRADIDALPIKEENQIEFCSKNNFMHACGHDVHTSILYSFLNYVLENKIKQNILFLFQPAEESGGGAMEFFKTGIFNQFTVTKAFALHVTDEYSQGTIASTKGVLFASSLEVNINFQGVSSHVAFPQEGKNAFNALRLFLDSVDKIPRNISEPFVFGAGRIEAGEIRNIIPGHAKLEGTIRGLSNEGAQKFYESLINILEGIQKITGVKYHAEKGASYPEVIVNEELYDQLTPKLSKEFNFIDCGYKMTGEDFGYISHQYPSFMFWLGTSNGEKFGLHNPRFLPDDSVIETGKNAFVAILKSII